jgi:hypothetical protein
MLEPIELLESIGPVLAAKAWASKPGRQSVISPVPTTNLWRF